MTKKSSRQAVNLPEDVVRRTEDYLEVIGSPLGSEFVGQGGCQTYGRLHLKGIRLISDEVLTQVIKEAEERGAVIGEQRATAEYKKIASDFEKNAAKVIKEAEQLGYDRCLREIRETVARVKVVPRKVARVVNPTGSPGVSKFSPKE